MRVVGVDYGRRRIGLAVSDATGVLARPLETVTRDAAASDAAVVAAIATRLARLADDGDPVTAIVVGLPRRLDGSPNEQTPLVERFAEQLGEATRLPVVLQDERLTSHEAESRLAIRERDWRRRKARLDAAAAAVILQDYLDSRRTPSAWDQDHTDRCAD
jgi:putative Holliday junction resolvase